jgi:hypothetical protein
MSFDPCRRRGTGVAGARARLGPAGPHRGACRDFLRRHETEATAAARGTATAKKDFAARLLPRAADSRNLRLARGHLAAEGGQAPGLDGLRSDDLEGHEVWGLVRILGKALLGDTYRPGPDRRVAIPKAGGAGTRVLSIPSVIDRLVQRAVVQVLQPYLDCFLGDGCLGYRLCRGEGGLKVSLTERSWKRLSEKLELCHEKDCSSVRAVETVLGWVGQMGPCLPATDVDGAYARVVSLAKDLAFDELPTKEEVTRSWRLAYLRWERCREQSEKGQGECAGGSAYRNCETGGARRPAGAP